MGVEEVDMGPVYTRVEKRTGPLYTSLKKKEGKLGSGLNSSQKGSYGSGLYHCLQVLTRKVSSFGG